MNSLIIGTRGSPLALAQTEIVRTLLQSANPNLQVESKIIKTSGDNFTSLSLVAGGGKGLFTKEIEDQLLRGEIHVAVHSLKDLPTTLPDGLIIGAVPPRENAHDVLILKGRARPPGAPNHFGLDSGPPGGRALPELPHGAQVATSSLRRRVQLLAQRPDLQIEEIRGNVETRLRKLAENEPLDALILAAAGLKRLGFLHGNANRVVVGADSIRDRAQSRLQTAPTLLCIEIGTDVMIPAVGQGAIACEVREMDVETRDVLARINDADTDACTTAERVFLRVLGGGCQVPYAAHATVEGERLRLVGATFSHDGKHVSRVGAIGPKGDPHEVGRRAAKQVVG